MVTDYAQALREWGARRLSERYKDEQGYVVDVAAVTVDFEFEPGYQYSEYTGDSATAWVCISDGQNAITIDPDDFDFAVVLEQILEGK